MWGRGLKLVVCAARHLYQVAPHVGAWIETYILSVAHCGPPVAPHVGAWIETEC